MVGPRGAASAHRVNLGPHLEPYCWHGRRQDNTTQHNSNLNIVNFETLSLFDVILRIEYVMNERSAVTGGYYPIFLSYFVMSRAPI